MNQQSACCAPSVEPSDHSDPGVGHVSASVPPVRSDWIDLEPGEFFMGTDTREGYRSDGEGPRRPVTLGAYSVAAHAVSNADFDVFVRETGYITDAEQAGWSFVFQGLVSPASTARLRGVSSEAPWWIAVDGACWSRPEGFDSDVRDRANHPVTHVSWRDADAYCRWSGARLPTEAEWEFAARGGLGGKRYPWGNELLCDGRYRCNIWQGEFPRRDAGLDGYVGTAPVDAYEPNGLGLYNCVGNVWEWCEDWFTPNYHRVTRRHDPRYVVPSGRRSMRGGSFLCHHSYCNRYRVAARSSNTPQSTTNHCGFRVAACVTL